MKKTTKNILIASGIVAGFTAAVGTMTYVLSKKLVEFAMDRKDDIQLDDLAKSKSIVSGIKFPPEFLEARRSCSKLLKESEHVEITLTTDDGEELAGHWFQNKNAKRTIIAVHGWRSSWASDFGIISDFWHSNNCNVLYIEQRGQNNSSGNHMGFGIIEKYDCLEWIDWVNNRLSEQLPIYLCGVSMGASTVLMASGLNLPSNVHGIIADCGFTSPRAIWKHVAEKNLHLLYDGPLDLLSNDMFKRKVQVENDDFSCTETLEKCQVPVLFIHGSDDQFVPVGMTYENYKACPSEKRLLIVPGANHGMSYFVEKENYEEVVKEFWNDFD